MRTHQHYTHSTPVGLTGELHFEPTYALPLWPAAHSLRITWRLPHHLCPAVSLTSLLLVQDQQVINSIARYFQHPIPEVPFDNEDQFISVLNKAGLTDQTA